MSNTEEVKTTPFDASKLQIRNDQVYAFEKRYTLTNVEFRILGSSESPSKEWHKRFLLILIGLILTVVSKVIFFLITFSNSTPDQKKELNIGIQSWELIYLFIGFLLSTGCYFFSISKWAKNEKSELIIKIKNYFKDAGN